MTLPVQLPPPSPALTIHETAARIRRTAERARTDMTRNSEYWTTGWAAGVTNAIGGDTGELAALFPPETALEIADWLDTVASAATRHGVPLPPLALALVCAATT
ncbi:hypothetical protein [Streptomyces bauhiniae]|uniref:Uncharacterized protein n=1 Tax=Streptomyces bauhiniae TaxID=2340725 RepID=A0A7K3QR92_9ACTN|nr:hypothetical protein [Streptomyces bauhiniae]NEB92414.1 hypothetical protein [Streptomyces bauhiniae]